MALPPRERIMGRLKGALHLAEIDGTGEPGLSSRRCEGVTLHSH